MNTPAPTLTDLVARLAHYKGQFERTQLALSKQALRHKTRGIQGCPEWKACPLYVLAEDLGFKPTHNGDRDAFKAATGCTETVLSDFFAAADREDDPNRALVAAALL